MAHEINLVPDVKQEMIKALKIRNYVFFGSIVVAAIAVVIILVFATITGGQALRKNAKESQLNALSAKVSSYDNLDALLTIQEQLNGLSEIANNKKVLSRVFNVLSVILPESDGIKKDTVSISELNVDLEKSTLSFDAQVQAGIETDRINARAFKEFVKSLDVMKYDYGRYVDVNGFEIPVACIEETNSNGVIYKENNSIYAKWAKSVPGCDPSSETADEVVKETAVKNAFLNNDVEKIWRTPQFEEWYRYGTMTADGVIGSVPHFESQCYTYTISDTGSAVRVSEDNQCFLVTEVSIPDSYSDGRSSEGFMVLRFSATLTIDPDVFSFQSKHVMAIGPTGRQNVTDSYVQIKDMFKQKAGDV